ncbi:a-factor receptor [Steccherinum ochraceum]|uniref:A-factor receptor n=1 Tax=Steccherinum ochraceum TaxID=92696 RepID=A0A4R0QZV7_9APHY|nr:a-factor receptor [Steccherinum ochraceum]
MIYRISSALPLPRDRRTKLQATFLELLIGLGPPIAEVAVLYLLQIQRYIVYQGIGCFYAVSVTWLFVVLSSIWPIIIGSISCCYCLKSLRMMLQRRKQLRELQTVNPDLDFDRHFRLALMVLAQLAGVLPLSIFFLIYIIPNAMEPYQGFAAQHAAYDQVSLYALDDWLGFSVVRTVFETTFWMFIGSSFGFFFIFSFSEGARAGYVSLCHLRSRKTAARLETGGGGSTATDDCASQVRFAPTNDTLPV